MIAVPESALETDEQRRLYGWGFEPSPHVLAYVDPIEDAHARPAGESDRGIPLQNHPAALVRDDPDLWRISRAFLDGVRLPADADAWERLSGWEASALRTMQAAEARQMKRDARGGD